MSIEENDAINLIQDAAFQAQCNMEIYGWLSGLFKAILDESKPHSNISKLAKLGHYLTIDFENMRDCEREELEKKVAQLKQKSAA